jgi:hypothetical protein
VAALRKKERRELVFISYVPSFLNGFSQTRGRQDKRFFKFGLSRYILPRAALGGAEDAAPLDQSSSAQSDCLGIDYGESLFFYIQHLR